MELMEKTAMTSSEPSTLDLTQSNVDPQTPAFQPMLRELQANILKGHGRRFAYHIFLRLDAAKTSQARKWISDFARTRISSALALEQGRQAFKATGADGGAVFTLSLSATGYSTLGFKSEQFPKEIETPANSIVKDSAVFATGAKASAAKLGDGNVNVDWEEAFRGNVDVLIIVADSHSQKALELSKTIEAEVSEFSTVLLNQKGQVLHRKVAVTETDRGSINIEHFGYADGVSQPLFFKDEIEAQTSTAKWNDQESLNLVLVPDPNGRTNNSFGSFLVFRKLEQNVEAFMRAEESVLPSIKDSDGIVNKDLPGAMMVGRFRNGNPLVTSSGFTGNIHKQSQIANDFNYDNDSPPQPSETPAYSSKCPFFAHIRITNPRGDITAVPSSFVHSVRLTRRGIPYQDHSRFGASNEDLVTPTDEQLNSSRPATGAGLLFMSYQAHIGKQFEFIQNNWANSGHIAGRNVGPDGVVGQQAPAPATGLPFKPTTPFLLNRKLPEQWGQDVKSSAPDISFSGFVTNKGGEYFFTPSISFLQSLSTS
ncbi:MAG: hypothetical protein C5B50_05720 [Verrucomicrobia bacterium]|nr:MAG: hypothetical protein C5B50_05720 [Verrucomicrobiota bacterium]